MGFELSFVTMFRTLSGLVIALVFAAIFVQHLFSQEDLEMLGLMVVVSLGVVHLALFVVVESSSETAALT